MKVIIHLSTCRCKPEAVPVSGFIFILVAGKELMLMPASAIGFRKKNTKFHNTDGIFATEIWYLST